MEHPLDRSPNFSVMPLAVVDGNWAGTPTIAVSAALSGTLERHRAALCRFAASLHGAGIEPAIAAYSIVEVVDSYRAELIAAVGTYREDSNGC
ncbi:hypothetical protein EAH87_16235 [Sphingomonas koreensis]|nr:hypothetical protein EAH87_16235 [Sphingomonas koreensis]